MRKSLASTLLPKPIQDEISRVIEPRLRERALGTGVCSTKTAKERRMNVRASIAKLWSLGFKIRKLTSLKAKHIRALMEAYGAEDKSAKFLHNRLSLLRTLAVWLGKEQIVGDLSDYFPKERTKRVTATETDRSWEANGVSPLEIIALAKQFDERLAVMLSLQHFFAMRVKESIEFRPGNSLVDNGDAIEIDRGTKGGKPRRFPIISDAQREVIAWARDVVASGKVKRVRWPECTWQQAQSRFYRLIDTRLGLTKDKRGVTPHGLRNGGLMDLYHVTSGGFPTPIEVAEGKKGGGSGGSGGEGSPAVKKVRRPVPPPGLTREMHHLASMTVSRAAGHGRIDVTASYYGTYGHGFRTVAPPTSMAVVIHK